MTEAERFQKVPKIIHQLLHMCFDFFVVPCTFCSDIFVKKITRHMTNQNMPIPKEQKYAEKYEDIVQI